MEKDYNQEQMENVDRRKSKYIVPICRDTAMMKTFVQFSNKVKHPRVSMNMCLLGITLIALPIVGKGIALPGVIISYVMGGVLVLMGLFRQYISVAMMKADPQVKENEELTYQFGNSGIRVEKNGSVENMGYYKDVYRVWEDEKNYFVGMNEEDLLILPKSNFVEGDAKSFRDFILEKSGADYRWKPTGAMNIIKNKWMNFNMKMSGIGNIQEDERK